MIKFRAYQEPWSDTVSLLAKHQDQNGTVRAATCTGIELRPVQEGSPWPQFTGNELDLAAAQSLFDALWSIGLRPNKGEASAAHVEALKYHLEDMRRIVFKAAPNGE